MDVIESQRYKDLDVRITMELPLAIRLKQGARGPLVYALQEWLCFHHAGVEIDGRFGPATKWAR
mgnify:CR=1 FL=1